MPNYSEMKHLLGLAENAGGRQTENAAIRALCPGGSRLLDALDLVNRLNEALKIDRPAWTPHSTAALESLRELRRNMLIWVKNLPAEEFRAIMSHNRAPL